MSCPPFFLFSLRFSLIPHTYTVPCLSTYCSTSDVVQPQTSQTCSRHSARVLGQSGGDLAPQAEGVTQQLQHSWPALAAFVLAWSLTRHRTQGGLRECVGVLHYTGTAPVLVLYVLNRTRVHVYCTCTSTRVPWYVLLEYTYVYQGSTGMERQKKQKKTKKHKKTQKTQKLH